MAYPTTLALITALWSGPGRTRSIALWSALGGAISALGPLARRRAARALLVGLGVPASRCRWRWSRSSSRSRLVPEPRQRDDRPGRQPRRHPLGGAGRRRSCSPSTSRRCPTQGTLALGLAVIALGGARRASSSGSGARESRSTTSTSRRGASSGWRRAPASSCSARSWPRCSSASSSSRTCSATPRSRPGASILPAVVLMVIVAPRSAKLVEARGARFTLLARLRLLPARLPHDAGALEGGHPVLEGRARLRVRRHRRRLRGHAGVALAHRLGAGRRARAWRRAPPTSSATSAGRSCSRSSARCSPPATRPRSRARSRRRRTRPGQRQRREPAHEVVLERGRTPPSSTRSTRSRSSRRPRQSFVDGADWAYVAGIVAILLGAVLVFFFFPKMRREKELLAGVPRHRRRGARGRDRD